MNKYAFKQEVHGLLRSGNFSKIAEKIEPYIRLRVYEDSFADRVLAVRDVAESDLIVETNDDSFYVHGKVEQGTANAVVANFTDRPTERVPYGPRFKIPLGKHNSPIISKNLNELMAYDYDILADAQEKDVYSLGALRDWKLIVALNDCITLSGKSVADKVNTATTENVEIAKDHILEVQAALETGGRYGAPSKDRLKAKRLLMSDQLFKDFSLLNANVFGDSLAEEAFKSGILVKTVMGMDYVASVKDWFFVESDAVSIITVNTALTNLDTFTLDGVTVHTSANDADATASGAGIAAGIDALAGYSATADAGVVRVVRTAYANDDEQLFIASHPTFGGTGLDHTTITTGYDRYDVFWSVPEANFIGEMIRVSGRGIETEMWKTDGEEVVNRVSREFFGMGIGNFNGVAKSRIQRSRYIP